MLDVINKSKKEKLEKKKLDWLWFGSVFLFALNFLGKYNHLILSILFVGILITVYKKSVFKITLDLILVLFFSLSYFLILNYHTTKSFSTIFTYMIGPVGAFFIGYSIIKFENEFIFKTILSIVLANFIHGILNMFLYFRLYGIAINITGLRIFPDIWSEYLSATLQATFFTPIISLLFYSIFLNKNRRYLKFAIIISIIFSLIFALIMGSRTIFAIMFIVFLSNFILYIFMLKKKPKYITKVFILIACLLISLYMVYTKNVLSIKDFVEGSTFYMRSKTEIITKDPRILIYQRILSQIFDFPFGGYKMNLGLSIYAHNLWLDVLYATGLLPFFLLCLYTLKTIVNLMRLLKQKNIDNEFKIFIFSIYTAYLLNFMVEPILEGVPYMFITFCLINGMIRKLLDVNKKSNCFN